MAFPSILELANDKGAIGQVLSQLPVWTLKEADRWPDPWTFLCGLNGIALSSIQAFRAAQSQRAALSHLGGMAVGYATVKTDWSQEMKKAHAKGDQCSYSHAMDKVAAALTQFEVFRADERNPELAPEIRQVIRRQIEKRRGEFMKRRRKGEKDQAKPLPRARDVKEQFRLSAMLVEWWVRCGETAVPGLMFWRNEAMFKFLGTLLNQTNSTPGSLKKMRQRLGLVLVRDKAPWVWDVGVKGHNSTGWKIVGVERDGSLAFNFCGTISFNGKSMLPSAGWPS